MQGGIAPRIGAAARQGIKSYRPEFMRTGIRSGEPPAPALARPARSGAEAVVTHGQARRGRPDRQALVVIDGMVLAGSVGAGEPPDAIAVIEQATGGDAAGELDAEMRGVDDPGGR